MLVNGGWKDFIHIEVLSLQMDTLLMTVLNHTGDFLKKLSYTFEDKFGSQADTAFFGHNVVYVLVGKLCRLIIRSQSIFECSLRIYIRRELFLCGKITFLLVILMTHLSLF